MRETHVERVPTDARLKARLNELVKEYSLRLDEIKILCRGGGEGTGTVYTIIWQET